MSEPITLTERERAVFAHMARTLGNGTASHDIIVSNALLHFLDADYQVRSAQSASPPRVPGASAKLEADFREFIKKAEPGNLAELIETVAYERGRRAGIEAAAQWHEKRATQCGAFRPSDSSAKLMAEEHRGYAAVIRTLAAAPPVDPLLAGLQHVMAYMIREPWTANTIRTFIQCEITARTGEPT